MLPAKNLLTSADAGIIEQQVSNENTQAVQRIITKKRPSRPAVIEAIINTCSRPKNTPKFASVPPTEKNDPIQPVQSHLRSGMVKTNTPYQTPVPKRRYNVHRDSAVLATLSYLRPPSLGCPSHSVWTAPCAWAQGQ